MFRLALVNIWRKKGLALLAIAGVALGCALMTFLLAISAGLDSRLGKAFSGLASGMVVSSREAIFGGLFFSGGKPLPVAYLHEIRQLPHVQEAYGRVTASLRPVANPNLILPLTGYTAEEIQTRGGTPFVRLNQGRAPQNDREIIIGKRLQESLQFIDQGFTPGKEYQFALTAGGQPQMITLTLTGIFETDNELANAGICGSAALAREAAYLPADKFSSIDVQVGRPEMVATASGEIVKHFRKMSPAVQVVTPRDVLTPVMEAMGLVNKFLLIISLVCAAASGLSIAILMTVSVLDRMKEFAILKAVGWRGRQVVSLVMIESLVLSLGGAALGVGLGYAGTILARHYIGQDIIIIDLQVIGTITGTGVIIGTFGGLYPAWRAKQATPAEIFCRG